MSKVQPDRGGTYLAGSFAYASDVVRMEGCSDWTLSSGELWLWRRDDEPITTTQELDELLETTPPLRKVTANGEYQVELEAGPYLVCTRTLCANLTLSDGRTTTLNATSAFGPGVLYLAEAGASRTSLVESVGSGALFDLP